MEAYRQGGALYQAGRYGEALSFWKKALELGQREFGPDHPQTAAFLNNLAALYQAQGRYAEAEPLYKRALAIDEKALGLDHPGLATDLNNLADLYRAQGRYAKAEPLFKRSLAIREKALGAEHPDVAAKQFGWHGVASEITVRIRAQAHTGTGLLHSDRWI